MRKFLFAKSRVVHLTLLLVVLFAAFVGCKKELGHDNGFVYIEDGSFKVDGEEFFPLMLNYKVDLMEFDDTYVFVGTKYYEDSDNYEATTRNEAVDQFTGHMQLIEDLGFNTVRICINVVYTDEKGIFYKTQNGGAYLKQNAKQILDALEEMMSIVEAHNLKVLLLIKPSWNDELAEFNSALMKRFAGNKALFAFDLFNEPLYFDMVNDRPKHDAVNVVTKWVKKAKRDAPNHLVTISFAEPIEVFSWDPSVMPIDFVEVHTYNPLSIPNETWWWGNYIGKPWMIGETSLPADNDSVTYEQQCHFLEQTYQYVIDCGGIGFGWWEFQDVPISYNLNYEGTYPGILNHEGTTITSDGHVILGTLKPVAYRFSQLKSLKKGTPVKAVNYYNNFGYHNAVIRGRIVDDRTGKPIEGAAIRGWNQWWQTGLNTATDSDGLFTLYSNDECVHFAISAPGMDTQRFDMHLEYSDVNGQKRDFTGLPDRHIKSSMVSFKSFLKDNDKLFDFKEDEFDKAEIFADMGEIRLKKLEIK